MILDTTSKSLQAVLSEVITTTQPTVVVSYVDITSTTFTPGSVEISLNSTTPVTILTAPAASTKRQIKEISIYNSDTINHNVTVSLNDSSVIYNFVKLPIIPYFSLIYSQETGWTFMPEVTIPTGPAGGDLTGTYPNPNVVQIQNTAVTSTNAAVVAVLDNTGSNAAFLNQAGGYTTPTLGISPSDLQTQLYIYWQDTSVSTNSYIITPNPPIFGYADGQRFSFKAASTNTGQSSEVININGVSNRSIYDNSGASLLAGAILLNGQYDIEFNSTYNAFILLNPSGYAGIEAIQDRNYTYTYDTGTANAYAINTTPVANNTHTGQIFTFLAANTNTGASQLNLNSFGGVNIRYATNRDLTGGEIVANTNVTVEWSAILGCWIILNPFDVSNALQILTPLTGDTIDLSNFYGKTVLNPAGTLATLTINLSNTEYDGQIQTISTTQNITSLTVSGNGNSIIGQPTTLLSGQSFSMRIDYNTGTWYPN